MFTLKDYLSVDAYRENQNDTNIKVNLTFNREKIEKDIQELKTILMNLENLIGPYTLKVHKNHVKLKEGK